MVAGLGFRVCNPTWILRADFSSVRFLCGKSQMSDTPSKSCHWNFKILNWVKLQKLLQVLYCAKFR